MKIWVFAGLLTLAQMPGTLTDSGPDGLDSETKGWLVGRPAAVADSVEYFSWPSQGGQLFYVRRLVDDRGYLRDPDAAMRASKVQLWSYSPAQEKGRMLKEFPAGSIIAEMKWAPESSVGSALVGTRINGELVWTIFQINGQTGGIAEVFSSKYSLQVLPQPSSSTMAVWEDGEPGTLHIYQEGAGLRRVSTLRGEGSVSLYGWISPTVLGYISPATPVGESNRLKIDINSGQIAEMTSQDEETAQTYRFYGPGNREADLYVDRMTSRSNGVYTNEWVVRANPPGISPIVTLSKDADYAELANDLSALAIIEKGVVTVRKVTSVPRSELLGLLERQERTKLVNQAKQAGTAMHIYASDYDDIFPPGSGNIRDALMPYVRDASIIDQVVFYPPAGEIGKLERIAETPMGHIDGKFGRATIYADGHVVWVSNQGGR